MKKYTKKSDAMNDYFNGKLTVNQLMTIAKNTFHSDVATKQELNNFLKNKFLQDIMSDTYNIDSSTLVKRVKELLVKL